MWQVKMLPSCSNKCLAPFLHNVTIPRTSQHQQINLHLNLISAVTHFFLKHKYNKCGTWHFLLNISFDLLLMMFKIEPVYEMKLQNAIQT